MVAMGDYVWLHVAMVAMGGYVWLHVALVAMGGYVWPYVAMGGYVWQFVSTCEAFSGYFHYGSEPFLHILNG